MTWQQIMAAAHAGLPGKPLPGLGDLPIAEAEATGEAVAAAAPSTDRSTLAPAALDVVADIGRRMQVRLEQTGAPDSADSPEISAIGTRGGIVDIGTPRRRTSGSGITINGRPVGEPAPDTAPGETGSTRSVE
jgi:hypothetical protein